jgi:Protein of unknown function (DUF1553)/Protein of unknown function (DUF1549)/Concanavalin A-like lectin/glucanases superfamily/Planctomycete cytochrome C
MANLRLDAKDGGAFRAIKPGDSAHSNLYLRVSSSEKSMRMPPVGNALTEKQVRLIKDWIDGGAKWETHWSFVPPKRPALPEVSQKSWVRNPIDDFVLARLEHEQLKPSPEADRATLLRRVTFDLTGLPPTPSEVDAFLADKSKDAYEKRVDALLARPQYGERMAMQWLDLARYADTHGYHIDSHREMWHWRDWLIGAFNRNEPYDQFTVDQLAGDLIPNATPEQRLATGFNRNHMINFEGGAIPEEYQNEYVVDRLEATSNVFMGLTMGCARCHDHKYDPISQRDFYRFYAFFNTIPEQGLDGRKGNAAPLMQLPDSQQAVRLSELADGIKAKEKVLDDKEIAALLEKWTPELEAAPRKGLLAHYTFDGSLDDSSGNYRDGRFLTGEAGYNAGIVNKEAEFDAQTQADFGTFDVGESFAVSLWYRSGAKEPNDIFDGGRFAFRSDEAIPIGNLQRGAHLTFRAGGFEVTTKRRLPNSTWYQLTVNCDAQGVRLMVDGKEEAVEAHAAPGNAEAKLTLRTAKGFRGQLDELRIYNRLLSSAEVGNLYRVEPASATLRIAEKKRSKDQEARLRDYFLTNAAAEPYRSNWIALKGLKAEKEALDNVVPTSMVMEEMAKPRETAILARGDYRNRGDIVTPGVPSMLPPLPKDAPLNRLTLAKWLVDPTHPLTARVAMNRYWQLYFGTGIVKTVEDFGSQGEPPSHPELLDWLATEFIRTGWDVKAMQRLIVTSAAYRQASQVTPELLEKDPENRLIARGPRYRLPAEMVRDNALSISGLLKERVGGPSVFPYQPKGLWEETAFGDVYSAQTYTPSHGDDLYRRGMYTFWKRTSGPPSLITFDAPDREKCLARRSVTNTPLQALVLLNDPVYLEASRALAHRILTEAPNDPGKRIAYAFRLATARTPRTQETQVLRDLEEKELAVYKRDPAAARKLLSIGESPVDPKLDPSEFAAWMTVSSSILNLDETITKQ